MISHAEAQELHESIGVAVQQLIDGVPVQVELLQRARELAAVVVADTDEAERDEAAWSVEGWA